MLIWRRGKKAPEPQPVTSKDVIDRWKRASAGPSLYENAEEAGLAQRKTSYPYAVATTDERGELAWSAPNYRLAGNVLVMFSTSWPGVSLPDPDGADVYAAAVNTLFRLSDWRLNVTDTSWLLGTTTDIATIHREIGDALGLMSRSLVVVDLYSGRAIGWDMQRGVMTEIEPARPG